MTCFIKCLNALGLPAKATRNGPLWALADGNEILKQFDHIVVPVPRDSLYTSGRYVVYTGDNHFVAVGVVGNMRVMGDDDDLEVLNDVALGNLVANNHVKVYELKKRDESIWGAGCWVPPWAVDSLGGGKRIDVKGTKAAAKVGVAKESQKRAECLNLTKWISNVKEDWFSSTSSFHKNFMHRDILKVDGKRGRVTFRVNTDSHSLRALLVFMKFGALQAYQKCPVCKKSTKFQQSHNTCNDNDRYQIICASYHGKECWQTAVTSSGILHQMRSSDYAPFLHFVLLMKSDYRMKMIYQELYDHAGIRQSTVDRWKVKYQESLEKYLLEVDAMEVGGNKEVVALDESAIGKDYSKVNKPKYVKNKPRRIHQGRHNPLLKKVIPGMTMWKRPAMAVKKRPATRTGKKIVRNPSKDKRSNSRWLWTAVECGKEGGQKKSHKNHTKRIAMTLLPRKADAPENKPRGKESLLKVMQKHLMKKSLTVADDWTATPVAVKAAGSIVKGTVNHTKNWRNPDTGVHSNDAESEFARFKLFLRVKYDFVRMNNSKDKARKDRALELKLAEYVFYTNVGREKRHIMMAFAYSGNVSGQKWCF